MAKGDMAWVRKNYRVPAKRGAHVVYEGRPAVITSASAPYLWIRFKGGYRELVHPTWKMEYVDEEVDDDA